MTTQGISQQLKQKILNYEIKTIQQCQDSLFTDYGCEHQRYLAWELDQQLKHLLKNYHHTYRWIGNDKQAYVYSYFYMLVIGCATHPTFMMKLKIVLYDLGQKYLAQYQQKLVIEFLCLIQYSQDKYTFFRKYSKIQGILLKIFKQIEARNPSSKQCGNENSEFSKLTTCVTSPSNIEDKISILRNSDYYNSSMKRIEKEYKKAIGVKHRQSSYQNKLNCLQWYEVYNHYFYFLKMKPEGQKYIRFKIDIKCQDSVGEEYLIAVQRGCFFVIEMVEISKQLETGEKNKQKKKVEESQLYLKELIHKEFLQSKILNPKQSQKKNNSCRHSKAGSSSATPKFITNKKSGTKVATSNHFYKDSLQEDVKSVQVQVLQVSQFDDSKNQKRQQEARYMKQIEYKKKIDSLDNIGETIQTIHHQDDKNSIVNQIRSHPLFADFMNHQKKKPSQEEIQKGQKELTQKKKNPEHSNCSIELHEKKEGKIKQLTPIVFLPNQIKSNNQIIFDNITVQQTNPELKGFYPSKIEEIPANQTMLSAKMIRKNYKFANGLRDTLINKPKYETYQRPFHSTSPPAHLLAKRHQYLSPINAVNDQKVRPITRYIPKKIKFTYL